MPSRITIACLLLSASVTAAAADTPQLPYTLPTKFEAGLIFVEPVTDTGIPLSLFTDTGGGLFLSTSAADKLGVDYTLPEDGKSKGPVAKTPWPAFRTDAWIPQPVGTDDGIAVMQVPPHMAVREACSARSGSPTAAGSSTTRSRRCA